MFTSLGSSILHGAKLAVCLLPLFAAHVLAQDGPDIEPGDYDGDGVLTVADLRIASDPQLVDGNPALPGLNESPCRASLLDQRRGTGAPILVEILRRAVEDSLPNWNDMWLPPSSRPVHLPADERVRARFEDLSAVGGQESEVESHIVLELDAPVTSFLLIVDAQDKILHEAQLPPEEFARTPANWEDIGFLSGEKIGPQRRGDKKFATSPAAFLVSNGRIVVSYNFMQKGRPVLESGIHRIPFRACLPAEALGEYSVSIHPGSQVLFVDGTVAAPTRLEPGVLSVAEEVVDGCGESIPPLEFDELGRRILGRVQYRIVNDETGQVGTGEIPIAEISPGEAFRLRVQMRTEVPLNSMYFRIPWAPDSFCCFDENFDLLKDPEDPTVEFDHLWGFTACATLAWGGLRMQNDMKAAGTGGGFSNLYLSHFPVGSWLDLAAATVRIPLSAQLGERFDLVFERYERPVQFPAIGPFPAFVPYRRDWPCTEFQDDWPERQLWNYDVSYQDTFVRLLSGGAKGADVEEILDGYEVEIGDAEIVGPNATTISVRARNRGEATLSGATFVFETSDQRLVIDGFEIDFRDIDTNEVVRTEFFRANVRANITTLCPDLDGDGRPDNCAETLPVGLHVSPGEPATRAAIRISNSPSLDAVADIPINSEFKEVFRLVVRAIENVAEPETVQVRDSTQVINVGLGAEDQVLRTSALPIGGECTIPMRPERIAPGRVVLLPGPNSFRRGDGNANGQIEIADVIGGLAYLFLGEGDPGCLDAADSDDNGEIEVTDAVVTLSYMFLGTGDLPAPFPECGEDPTVDELGCQVSCVGAE